MVSWPSARITSNGSGRGLCPTGPCCRQQVHTRSVSGTHHHASTMGWQASWNFAWFFELCCACGAKQHDAKHHVPFQCSRTVSIANPEDEGQVDCSWRSQAARTARHNRCTHTKDCERLHPGWSQAARLCTTWRPQAAMCAWRLMHAQRARRDAKRVSFVPQAPTR